MAFVVVVSGVGGQYPEAPLFASRPVTGRGALLVVVSAGWGVFGVGCGGRESVAEVGDGGGEVGGYVVPVVVAGGDDGVVGDVVGGEERREALGFAGYGGFGVLLAVHEQDAGQ